MKYAVDITEIVYKSTVVEVAEGNDPKEYIESLYNSKKLFTDNEDEVESAGVDQILIYDMKGNEIYNSNDE